MIRRRHNEFPFAAAVAVLLLASGSPVHADPADRQPAEVNLGAADLASIQGLLAVQQLDGWLLYDHRRSNPIAHDLIAPDGEPARRWFYLIRAQGQPTALIHEVDARHFERVPGRKLIYSEYREFQSLLAKLLEGQKRVAMEYSPGAALPSVSRVDAGTVERVQGLRVKVVSSAKLVQLTHSMWSPRGRTSHYVAAHHIDELRRAACEYIADTIRRGRQVTERQVQRFIKRGYKVRGLVGPPPVVAAAAHTGDPHYRPGKFSAPIETGQLLMIRLAARVESDPRGVYATTTWMAYVGDSVPPTYADAFAVVARARDAALALIEDRVQRNRALAGFEVDRRTRQVVAQAGHADHFLHRTGHSLDTQLEGSGANLDDYETHDTRSLVHGAGFTVAPGIYLLGEFGVRTEVDVYLGRGGVEITTAKQDAITPILADSR